MEEEGEGPALLHGGLTLELPTELWVMLCHRLASADLRSLGSTCRFLRHLVFQHFSAGVSSSSPFLLLLPREQMTAICRKLSVADLFRLGATCRLMRRWIARFCFHCIEPAYRQEHLTKKTKASARSRFGWKKFWFVLDDGAIEGFQNYSRWEDQFTPKMRIRLDEVSRVARVGYMGAKHVFLVTTAKWTVLFSAESDASRLEWMKAIHLSIMQIRGTPPQRKQRKPNK